LYAGYWGAPIFHSTPDAFAFSEPMVPTVIAAPIIWVTGNRVLAYNCLLVLALALNGSSAFWLLRRVRVGWLASFLGGVLVELLPLVHNEVGVLQLVPLCGILWTIHALYAFGKRPSVVRSALMGTGFAFTYLMCAYYGLFLSVLLVLGGGWLVARRLARSRTWLTLPIGVGVCLLLVGPVVMTQLRVAREHDLERSHKLVCRLSADPVDYLASPWPHLVEPAALKNLRRGVDFRLCPGFLRIGLALVGAVVGLAQRRYRCWTAFCLTVLGFAFILSMGPKHHLAGLNPYAFLMDWYPGFAQVRSAFRFAVFVQLMVALLAALGLHTIGRFAATCIPTCCHRKQRRPRVRLGHRFAASALTAVIGFLAIVEILPARQDTFPVPPVETQSAWIQWLKSKTPEDCAIACLPFPKGTKVREYEKTAMWMYWGTFHQRRMVSGYSGFFPRPFLELKEAMQDFPDEASLRMLKERGVDYCVVRRSYLTHASITGNPVAADVLVWVFGDDQGQVDVYRLLRQSRKPE